MVEIKKYHLAPTALIPNSPLPLLHYPGFLSKQTTATTNDDSCNNNNDNNNITVQVHDLFARNGWQVQWVYRYGPTQQAHYHSTTHECMAVLSGEATIRFGTADSPEVNIISHHEDDNSNSIIIDMNKDGSTRIDTSLEIHARAGDVFVLPAGVAHKTFDTMPSVGSSSLQLLNPGDGHRVAGYDPRRTLAAVQPSGFSMIGAYPVGGEWDVAIGGEHSGRYEEVWSVPRPERDPVLGLDPAGLTTLWNK